MLGFWGDVRRGLRLVVNHPGFTFMALLSIGLGVGVNATIFTLTNALLLRPLPLVRAPERLVWMSESSSYPDFLEYRSHPGLFDDCIAFDGARANLDLVGGPEPVRVQMVSGNYFPVLGVSAASGRVFTWEEDAAQAPVAVLGQSLWRRSFSSDPGVIGQSIRLNGLTFSVIGIAPADFTGTDLGIAPDLWIPLSNRGVLLPAEDEGTGSPADPLTRRDFRFLNVVGRLKEGQTLAQAQAVIDAEVDRLSAAYPESHGQLNLRLRTSSTGGDPRDQDDLVPAAGMILAITALVMLIACANVAGLILARSASRRKDLGVRVSLGAGRGRLIQQAFAENLPLTVLGAAAGLILSLWTSELLFSFAPTLGGQIRLDLTPDFRVFGFLLALTLFACLSLSLAPALEGAPTDIVTILRDDGRGGPTGGGTSRQARFVTTQIVLSIVLLSVAALFVRSLQTAQQVDLGFDPGNVLVASLDLGRSGTSRAEAETLRRRTLEEIRALAGVISASLVQHLPLDPAGSGMMEVLPEGWDEQRSLLAQRDSVSPDYFNTLGIRLLRGRDFQSEDGFSARPVAIVNQTAENLFWPGRSGLGQRVHLGGPRGPLATVVGVAEDGKYRSLSESRQAMIYQPLSQDPRPHLNLAIRTAVPPGVLAGPLRRGLRAVDPEFDPYGVQSLSDRISDAYYSARAGAALLGLFGLLGLALSAAGIFGLTAHSVALRIQEFGVRRALGAEGRHIFGLALSVVAGPLKKGFLIGIPLSLLSGRLLARFLVGTSPADPLALLSVAALFSGVAVAAAWWPARRASRVDPADALRRH